MKQKSIVLEPEVFFPPDIMAEADIISVRLIQIVVTLKYNNRHILFPNGLGWNIWRRFWSEVILCGFPVFIVPWH